MTAMTNTAYPNINSIPSLAKLSTDQVDTTRPPVILVDGSYYLFRCFHGLPPLSNSQGLPTNAIRGVLNALNKLIKKYHPTHMAVAFDTKAPTFRHNLSEAYKAHRPPMDEALRIQIPYIHEMIEKLGIALIKIDGFEADDIIGTLAYQACQQGHRVIISTGDKDMAQLVNDCVMLEDSFTGKLTDNAGVIEKFGVTSEQIADYLALMGDASDGISGIPKVGQKTAAKLLNEYQNIDGILANLANIKGAVGKSIADNQDSIPLNRILATIVTNLKLAISFDDITLDHSQETTIERAPALYALFEELEFKKEMAQTAELLNLPHQPTDKAVSIDIHDNTLSSQTPILPIKDISYHTITTQQDFTKLLDKLNHTPYFAIDTETTDINWQHAKLVGISVSTADYEGYYIPVGHTADFDVLLDNQLPIDTVLSAFKPILENPNIGKIGQHLKYDAHIFKKYGINISPWQMDTMLASYVINAAATRHGMDALAKHYLGVQTTTFEDVAGKGAKQLSFDKVAMDAASQYACEDADITFRLFNRFNQHINQDKTAAQLLYHLEMPTAQILTQMEHDGILIDTDFLGQLSDEFDKKIMALQIEAERIADEPFNLASPKQLGEILFDKLGIAGGKKTKTGQYATSEAVLSKIEHPLIDVVLEHRSLSKLKSTYTDTLANAADEQGRVHTSYHQALTSTGRLSSSDPNLQNIPIRTDTGRLIREAFIAPKGRMILAADYSQIELRLMAHFSGDESLIRAFNHNLDIHTATAAEIMGKDISEVTPSERRAAKAVNFGLLYGMSAFGLAKQIEVDRAVAQDYIKRYFARYPAILEYMERTKTMAKQLGYVQTILGRKLYSPDIQSSNRMIKDAAERAAINAPLQGSAAEIIKLAMIAVDEVLPKDDAKLLLQVHDELVFEVDTDKAHDIGNLIKTAMQNALTDTAKKLGWAVDFAVPLVVEIGIGENWEQAH
ncbi:DNA polymerase I [Moraxella catarrhalis]|jgi:DNA-directed DNA polymerase|uniref:DNA polymerase I n=1 Tax=Moraxella catarrhalis TaxID=480 RepID=UPI0001D26338|nr:DNA polymerase I [Moraxella catarrhalis]ADG61940.1 DNA polymerase I [Moraxella catarrhalis BBH18]EKF83151.1 DNA polymerase I [Moraxella catarrhalis RH4]MCG6814765.1 DNA polymerase I [Moraxella catarrhalis]MPW56957.1 DNA polymerase I [Moraxella catarrhalis]MPW60890.1 DNA polymerase I [Moraxella catarrhalis]